MMEQANCSEIYARSLIERYKSIITRDPSDEDDKQLEQINAIPDDGSSQIPKLNRYQSNNIKTIN